MTTEPKKLDDLTEEERADLTVRLLEDQVTEQRKKLHFWREITKQPAQIDTGYVAQHLVSLVTGLPGDLMRGKGLDLADGSEIKSANFLDSLDKRGAIAPRWNFLARNQNDLEAFLKYPALYLISLDLNTQQHVRARVWRVYTAKHKELSARYLEWVGKMGRPKLLDPKRPDANFQLFPPRTGTDDDYARHGNGRDFAKLEIKLEEPPASRKIYHAEEDSSGKIKLILFKP